MYDHAITRGVSPSRPILRKWALEWGRLAEYSKGYSVLIQCFDQLYAHRPRSKEVLQKLGECFDLLVEVLEKWVERMKKILANRRLIRFVAEEQLED